MKVLENNPDAGAQRARERRRPAVVAGLVRHEHSFGSPDGWLGLGLAHFTRYNLIS